MSLKREVVVISDLHIGGAKAANNAGRGFRMNTNVDRLAKFIRSLAGRPPRSLELVINGDFVDVLAERSQGGAATLDPFSQSDIQLFSDLIERDIEVFAAVGECCRKQRVTILLGNHDVELSLPPFRRILESALGCEVGEYLRLIDDNQAYVIDTVLIEHGNRYDGYNMVAHDDLRRLRSIASRGERDLRVAFPPPPGSRLVVHVMNRIKHDYPFVDLLKPETTAAIPLLLALEPSIVRSGLDLYRLRREANRYAPDKHGKIPDLRHIADPGHNPEREPEPIVGVIDRDVPPDVARAYADAVDRDLGGLAAVDAFLRAEEPHAPRAPAHESDLVPMGDGAVSSALGLVSMLGKPTLAARLPALRRALQVLRDDRSFVLDSDDANSPYVLAARRLASASVRHVLFGHTHLAKHIQLGDGRTYTNTGTWADLAQIPFDDVTRMTDIELMAKIAEFLAALRGPRGTHSWIRWLPYCAVFHVTEDGHTPTPPELVPATELVPEL